ncbi:MAG TPA: tyrosine-type recombinase/integrase [Methylomirabilota bacterium]|nr:tyrosine-type recombinase/integrase [Methylomirabilota bacterium]
MQYNEKDFVQYLTIRRKLAPKSIKSYRIRFLAVVKWHSENNLELDKLSFEKFLYQLRERKLGNAALNTYIQAIKHLDSFCKDRGLPAGFTDGIEGLPKTHPEIIILTIDEINRLCSIRSQYKNRNGVNCSELDLKYRTLINFLSLTGCRFEEAASFQIKRIDLANGRATLINTKNKDNRYIYFNGPIKEDLSNLIKNKEPEDLVFTNSKGNHVLDGDFNNDLRLRAKTAGITKRVHAHLLRHSWATHMYVAGVDIATLATLLGHRDVQTTFQTYVHLADETLKRASMRNPLVRQYVSPSETLQTVKDVIENLRLLQDERFEYKLNVEDNLLYFQLKVK